MLSNGSVCCRLEMDTLERRPAPTSHDPTDVSQTIDDILAGYMNEPQDVPVITSAPQDVVIYFVFCIFILCTAMQTAGIRNIYISKRIERVSQMCIPIIVYPAL